MKNYIFAVVVVLFSSQAYSQVADDTPASYSAKNHQVNNHVSTALIGKWIGTYVCGQGATNAEVEIDKNLNAKFRFFLSSSSFGPFDGYIKGKLEVKDSNVTFRPMHGKIDGWTVPPRDGGGSWVAIGFNATLNINNKTLNGTVNGPGCSTLNLIASSTAVDTQPAAKPVALPPPSQASLGFHKAALNANYDMMGLYLQQGADINCLNCDDQEEQTILFRVLRQENYKFADWLIQRGADINITASHNQSSGVTAAMLAASDNSMMHYPSLTRLDYLIKNGADLKAVDSTGRNALLYITGWQCIDRKERDISGKCVTFIDQIITGGIDVNHQDKSGSTALMNAANVCSPASIKLLLSYGADPALKDKLGKSALDISMDRATNSRQGGGCNETVNILMNPQKVSQTPSVQPGVADKSMPANSEQQILSKYAGTYTGAFSGTFKDGSGKHDLSILFLAKILSDGSIKLYSDKGIDMGLGNVDRDGLATFTSKTGIDFFGKIDESGELNGTWKSQATAKFKSVAGVFKSSKIAP
jgi:hypothetical protein